MANEDQGSGEMEKRKTRRVKGAVVEYSQLEYTFAESAGSKKVAFLKNLSTGGLSMFVTELLEEGAHVYLSIYLYDCDTPIMAKGKVIWRQPSQYMKEASTQHFDVGIEFVEIGDDAKKLISQYVEKSLSKEDDEYKL